MNEEIKEILDTLQDGIENNSLIEVRGNAFKPLLDYITNLQEEYEKEHYLVDKLTRQLNDEYKNTEYQCKQKEDYKSRNEKAIEYITSEQSIETFKTIESREDWLKINHKLLKILQGDDKND